MISNAIIATLMAKSGRITGQNSGGDNAEVELYEELMKNSADRIKSQSENDALSSRVAEEVEYQDKQVISEMNVTAGTLQDRVEMDTFTHADSKAGMDFDFPTTYRRTQSEKLNGDTRKTEPRTLRLSETDKCQENARAGENSPKNLYPQDDLSNEEFQRTIEAFIAKQMRFLREESSAIVVQNQS